LFGSPIKRVRVFIDFQEAVERIRRRTAAASHPRSVLIRAWRFVNALKRRLTPWQSFDFFSRRSDVNLGDLASVALVPLHARLTRRFLEMRGDSAASDWTEHDRAWNLAVDYIAEQIAGERAALLEGDVMNLLPSLAAAADHLNSFLKPWLIRSPSQVSEPRPTGMWAERVTRVHETRTAFSASKSLR
jgi:hypothetical protein